MRAWLMLMVGLAALVVMREAYVLTREPAPAVRVRWRDGTTPLRRTYLEAKYRLVLPAAPEGLSYSYVLLDTRTSNIRALVKDPDVADTGDIDRQTFDIPWATAHDSRRFTWVAERTPGLRQPAVRWPIIALLVWMTATGARRVVAAIDWRRRTRAAHQWLHRIEMEWRDD